MQWITSVCINSFHKSPFDIIFQFSIVPSKVIEVKDEQKEKALAPIEIRPVPMVIDFKEEHPSKAQSSIETRLLPIVTDSKDEQKEKALSPMVETLPLMMMDFKNKQLKKASSLIERQSSGITKDESCFPSGYRIKAVKSLLYNTPSNEE